MTHNGLLDSLKSKAKIHIKTWSEGLLWKAGLDVRIRRADRHYSTRAARDMEWIRRLQPQTILDIGAFDGRSAATFRSVFPDAAIYSFEPVSESYDQLCRRMKDDPHFQAFPYALGDEDRNITFHRSCASETSSVLEMSELHRRKYPHTATTRPISVRMQRLDDLLSAKDLEHPIMVKLDVQGSELSVLRGGIDVISASKIVIIETSFAPLYEGQPLFESVYREMKELGFEYKGSFNQLLDPDTRRILQQDAIFLKD